MRPDTLTKFAQKTKIDARYKRLLFRSWHRGTRELDLLLGSFAERHLTSFSARQLDTCENILEHSDPDIYRWLTEAEPIPKTLESDVFKLLKHFKNFL